MRANTLGVAGGLAALALGTAVAEEVLYETSFENFPSAPIKTLENGDLVWTARGKSEVFEKFHRTGSKCLHIFGGEDNVLEVAITGAARKAQGLQFHAERWTGSAPFEFRVHARSGDKWVEVDKLDNKVITGKRFLSDVRVTLPEGGIDGLRFTVTAPEHAGVLIDDLFLIDSVPKPVPKIAHEAEEPIRRLLAEEDLFVSGADGIKTFRIPALITAMNGDLIACVDARWEGHGDLIHAKNIDIVIRRSTDNGKTWGPMEVVCDFGPGLPASDPSFILDRETGEIFCFYNYMDQNKAHGEFRLYVQSSKDHGKTWGTPRDITDQIAKPEWKKDFKFITSGRGIQRRNGDYLHTLVNLQRGLHLFGSRDRGKTWEFFDVPIKPANESKVIELSDESLMINCRVNRPGYRYLHVGPDANGPWTGSKETGLADPGCNGSIIRYTDVKDGYAKNRLLFSNASSVTGRRNLAVRISYDEGKTWSEGKVIEEEFCAYSSLSILKDGSIGILYEPSGHESVRFARLTLEDLTDGKDALSKPYEIR